MIKTIPEATRVKKAVLFYDDNDGQYLLKHYDTTILILNSKLEIVLARRCSNSSTRAIMQVADHFNLDKTEIQKKMISYTDFYKYPVGN